MAVTTLAPGRHSFVAPSTVFVPGGGFVMGSEDGRPDERPAPRGRGARDAYRTTRRYDLRGPEGGDRRVSRGGSPAETRPADVGLRVAREVP